MLALHAGEECGKCREPARMLWEHLLAHKVRRVEAGSEEPAHEIEDEGGRIRSHEAMRDRIESVIRRREQWRDVQGDVCFDCGDDTGISGES